MWVYGDELRNGEFRHSIRGPDTFACDGAKQLRGWKRRRFLLLFGGEDTQSPKRKEEEEEEEKMA